MKELKDLIDVCEKINRDCHLSGRISAQGHTDLILATAYAKAALKRAKVFEGMTSSREIGGEMITPEFDDFIGQLPRAVTIIVIPKEASDGKA